MSDWRDDAACRDTDPDAFYPDAGKSGTYALMICRRCPVRTECLAEALDLGDQFGIWGGLSVAERKNLRRRERRSGSPVGLRGTRR